MIHSKCFLVSIGVVLVTSLIARGQGDVLSADADHASAIANRNALLISSPHSFRAFGDTYDLSLFWECTSDCDFLSHAGSGPIPCAGLTYDGVTESCGSNAFSGAGIEVTESEVVNGDGTITVIIQIGSQDGSDLMPNGTECAQGDIIGTLGAHLGCDVGCDSGSRSPCISATGGDELDPNLPDPPYDLLEAKAVVLGSGGGTLIEFDLNNAGQTVSELGTEFTVGGVSGVTVTAMQFRYRIVVGETTGACCLPDDSCTNGLTGVECATLGGTYQGDFSLCPGPFCGVAVNDSCDTATSVSDGVTPFDTTDTTLDSNGAPPCDSDMGNDLWFDYIATCTGTLTIETCGGGNNGPNTVLEMFDSDDCATMTTAECADDSGCGAGGLASIITVATVAGNPYMIRVGASGGGDISGSLTVSCIPPIATGGACCLSGVSCADAPSESACTGTGGTYLGDGTICGVNFNVTALSSALHLETCSSNYNTVLNVFSACGGTQLASNDDCSNALSGGGADPDAPCFDPAGSSSERQSCTCLATSPNDTFFVQVTNFGGAPPPPGANTSLFAFHDSTCNEISTGACCSTFFLGDPICADDTTDVACAINGGVYQGNGSTCTPNPCLDCNTNGILDESETSGGTSQDCNTNGVPDECDIAAGTSTDLNTDSVPDECQSTTCGNGICGSPVEHCGNCPQDCVCPQGTFCDVNVCAECAQDIDCDDGIACTVDTCNSGNCGNTPDSGMCNDGVGCTIDICVPPTGCVFTPKNGACNDGINCTIDTCDSAMDCQFSPNASLCDDGNPCTIEGCQPGVGCILTTVTDFTPCDDGLFCTAADFCTNGVCDGYKRFCPSNQCNRGICNENLDQCIKLPKSGASCSDGDQCTNNDKCLLGNCVGGRAKTCNDGNACTLNQCLPNGACLHLPVNSPECDCNSNGVVDELDIAGGTSLDFDTNGIPDECDLDCNNNGVSDNLDISGEDSLDLNSNGVPDECGDCNSNGIPDLFDVAGGTASDLNGNDTPDACEDCNTNGVADGGDISGGPSFDTNFNGVPDECESDCNANSMPDDVDIVAGTSLDTNSNAVPDECEDDCNSNGIPDDVDIAAGTSNDFNQDDLPDECFPPPLGDANFDQDVDLEDFAAFAGCFGASIASRPECEFADLSNDGIVGLIDYLIFDGFLSGPIEFPSQ